MIRKVTTPLTLSSFLVFHHIIPCKESLKIGSCIKRIVVTIPLRKNRLKSPLPLRSFYLPTSGTIISQYRYVNLHLIRQNFLLDTFRIGFQFLYI